MWKICFAVSVGDRKEHCHRPAVAARIAEIIFSRLQFTGALGEAQVEVPIDATASLWL